MKTKEYNLLKAQVEMAILNCDLRDYSCDIRIIIDNGEVRHLGIAANIEED